MRFVTLQGRNRVHETISMPLELSQNVLFVTCYAWHYCFMFHRVPLHNQPISVSYTHLDVYKRQE